MEATDTVEEQLIDLQSRLIFQEDMIQQLNEVVANQQRELEALRAGLEALQSRVGELLEAAAVPAEEAPPPHY